MIVDLYKWNTVGYSRPELFGGLGCQRFHSRNVWKQILRKVMPLLQIRGAVIGDPHLPGRVLPDKNLEREIDGDAWSGKHNWRASLRAPEDQQFGGRHFHSHLLRFSAMVNQREESYALRFQNTFEAFYRFIHRVIAMYVDDPGAAFEWHVHFLSNFRFQNYPQLRHLDNSTGAIEHCQ